MGIWEKVHTVSDSEGPSPLRGVADCGGRPHLYERVFSEVDDEYTSEYRLMEIDQDLLALLVESFQIFVQWRAGFDGPSTARLEALKEAIGGRDRIILEKSKLMNPRFKRFAEFEFEVMWEPVDEAPR